MLRLFELCGQIQDLDCLRNRQLECYNSETSCVFWTSARKLRSTSVLTVLGGFPLTFVLYGHLSSVLKDECLSLRWTILNWASLHCSGVIPRSDKVTGSCDLICGVPEGIVTIDDTLRALSWSGVPVLKVVAKS